MTTTKATVADRIQHLHPCYEAREWATGYTSPVKAWRECQCGNWMLWLVGKSMNCPPWSDGRKPVLACSLDCALTVKHLWPDKQRQQITDAVDVLFKWINGKATTKEAREARQSLYAYAAAVAAAYAAAVTYAAAVYAVAYAAAVADTTTATTAAYAAYAATATAAASEKTLANCADIVRRHFPKPPVIKRSSRDHSTRTAY